MELSITSSWGFAILVPAGARHNVIDGPSGPLKLYALYAPPNHRDDVVHAHQGGRGGRRRALRREDPNRDLPGKRSDGAFAVALHRYFFNKSRISVRSFTSGVGPEAGAGGSSFFNLLIPLMAKNKTPAMIRKFKATVRN